MKLLVPLVTPYTDDSTAISEIRLARAIKWHKEHGATGFVVMSAAGEPHTLGLAERKELLELVDRELRDIPMVVNVTGPTTAYSIEVCQRAEAIGAVAAVASPPPGHHLTKEEAVSFLGALRRYGGLSVSLFDASGVHADVNQLSSLQTGTFPGKLTEHGEEAIALNSHGSTCEFWTEHGIAHPLAMFGCDNAQIWLSDWARFKPLFQGLFKLGGYERTGKYFMEKIGIDCGPPRGPSLPLSPEGRQLVDTLVSAIQPR
ncbi:dihydrodipicolinate synthase family protein [Kamptonema cortianum]|nr:dihydrodipicolinate synthase family protein [Geitlerinema splendidum]MDK3158750.1 dihydrodipicolinate synthase family protein [Kamptonema cortianum]